MLQAACELRAPGAPAAPPTPHPCTVQIAVLDLFLSFGGDIRDSTWPIARWGHKPKRAQELSADLSSLELRLAHGHVAKQKA